MDPKRFVVVPGHVFPEAERVVDAHEHVVRKSEDLRGVVERTAEPVKPNETIGVRF